MPKTKNSNRQVVQTKKRITRALLSLMGEKPYANVTIQEIAQRADIDRRTFYRHYQAKEEVLDEYFHSFLDPYIENLAANPPVGEYEMALRQFTFLKEHVALLRLMKRSGVYGYLVDLYQRTISAYRAMRGLPPVGEEDRFLMAFKTGGFWNIVSVWLEDDPVKPPDEMARMVFACIENGILSACGNEPSSASYAIPVDCMHAMCLE